MKKLFPTFLLILLAYNCIWGQISISPSTVDFSTVISGASDSVSFEITNSSSMDFEVSAVRLAHPEYGVTDASFTVPKGSTMTVWVYIEALHNLDFDDRLLLESSSHPDGVSVQVTSHVIYSDAYYASTQNLWNEDLKSALKSRITSGYTQLSYNAARDEMYMVIDNQRVNGLGASVNTLECVYTGTLATGYVSRSDAQSSFDFNTEHTFPQAMFGSSLPMQSDLHHIFPTWGPSNSERANKPFGYVSSPSWTNGGSKSNSSTFEPRDEQKCASAAAILYMATRYEDFSGFCASQESALRDFIENNPPTDQQVKRNDDVFSVQNNRNPFIDHPEFLDRIEAVCSIDMGLSNALVHTMESLQFGNTISGVIVDGQLPVSNQGKGTNLNATNFVFSNPAFSFTSPPDSVIAVDELENWPIQFNPDADFVDYASTLTFSTNDPDNSTVTVELFGNTFPVGLAPVQNIPGVTIYPNPFSEKILIDNLDNKTIEEIYIFNNTGQMVKKFPPFNGNKTLNTSDLTPGFYFIHLRSGEGQRIKKMVLIR